MRYKISALLFWCIVLFSFNSFSQTTPSSDHPLLDKYYPKPEKPDTAKMIVNTPPTASVKAPTVSAITVTPPKPLPAPPQPKPVADTVEQLTPATTTVSQIQTSSAVKNTANTTTPITATVQPVITKRVVPAPANPPAKPMMDTRLGSSTPQYDTWKKNNDGAGSVTTSPK